MKRAEVINKALLVKLAWRVLTQGNTTCVKVVQMKYGLNREGPVIIKQKQRSSLIWKGFCGFGVIVQCIKMESC